MQLLKEHSTLLFLLVIVIICAFVRFYRLDTAPTGLLVDEPSFGYNAYSILKTSRDEHGKFFPLVFEAYGDDKMPLNVYAIVPSIALFGLTPFAIRLPGVLASIGLIPLIYLLVREIGLSKRAALLSSFFVSISPWTFYISRFTRETSIGLLVFTGGLLFLLKGIKQKNIYFWTLSFFLFGLSWYAYVSYRFVTLLFLPVLFMWFIVRRNISRKFLISAILVFVLTVLPLVFSSSSQGIGTARLSQIGLQSDQGPLLEIWEKRNYCALNAPQLFCYAMFNKATIWGRVLIERFVHVFSPEFLFTIGVKDMPIFSVPYFGMFTLIALPLLFLSVFILLKRTTVLSSFHRYFIIVGLMVTPLPAIFVGDTQNMRLAPLLPFLILLIGLGYTFIENNFRYIRVITLGIVVFAIMQSFLFFSTFFTVHVNKYDLQYNSHLPGLMRFLQGLGENKQLYVQPFFADPILYYAFYTQIDPADYQKETEWFEREKLGYIHAKKLKNMEITNEPIENLLCKGSKQSVYVTDKRHDVFNNALVYTAKSINGVYDYAFVYDLDKIRSRSQDPCSK